MSDRDERPTRLISLREGARAFQISVKTLRRRISDGTITGYKVGRLVRVDPEELASSLISTIPTVNGDE
ncbi:hypothetical protein GCM10027063_03660 [Promicromonospora xylanilytica]